MGKKYDKGYDDGWYNGYQAGLKDGKNGVAFVPEFAPTSYTGTGCIVCGAKLGDNFVCVNPSCPASYTVSSVNINAGYFTYPDDAVVQKNHTVEPDGKV